MAYKDIDGNEVDGNGRLIEPVAVSIWVHTTCGTPVESELWASDAENDYYAPYCPNCNVGLDMNTIKKL